jgi:hypothetical protein
MKPEKLQRYHELRYMLWASGMPAQDAVIQLNKREFALDEQTVHHLWECFDVQLDDFILRERNNLGLN